MSKNNDYTTGNLLDYEYFLKHYKLIAIDLSRQIELENPDLKQQINFIGKLKKDKVTRYLPLKKQKKLLLIFHKIIYGDTKDSSNEESKFATKKKKNGMS